MNAKTVDGRTCASFISSEQRSVSVCLMFFPLCWMYRHMNAKIVDGRTCASFISCEQRSVSSLSDVLSALLDVPSYEC